MRMFIISRLKSAKRLTSVTLLFAFTMTALLMTTPSQAQRLTKLEENIISHEGLSPFVYVDKFGTSTIGIGRNIDNKSGNGLSYDEMVYLMRNDIEECHSSLKIYEWYTKQNEARQDVLTELCYNMGMPHLLTFKKMIAALNKDDFNKASSELLDSKWRKEVGKHRSEHLAKQLKNGIYY